MKRDEAITTLRSHSADLARFGVSSLALFGSVARDEAQPASDVDLLVDFSEPVGLFHLFRLQHYLEELLGVERVDLVTRAGLKPRIKRRVLAEAVHVA